MRSISFLQNLIIPELQHQKSSFLQTLCSSLITFVFQVLSAIALNNQPPFQADKVQYEIQAEIHIEPKKNAVDLRDTTILPNFKNFITRKMTDYPLTLYQY